MRILVTGSGGQVGQQLVRVLGPHHDLLATTSASLDITSPDASGQIVDCRPDLVIHPAAWTDVDGCARDPERAWRVNGLGTRHVALACERLRVPLIYISTNEVFDGTATSPYCEWDTPRPINAYAHSKYAGEVFIRELVQRFAIVRIAWVFGGERNFVRTMLRLASERDRLSVVDDEIGNPTYAADVAAGMAELVREGAYGTFHLVNEGYCSRYEFAQEILRQAGAAHVVVEPIKLRDYARASTPPPFSALRNVVAKDLGIVLPPWQDALGRFLRTHHSATA